MKKLIIFLFIIFTVFPKLTLSFRETGHLLISLICEKFLTEETKQNLKELLSFFQPFTAEENNEYWFIESSLMADHLEEINMENFKTWHFQNFVYDQKENTQFDDQKESKKSASALWALSTLMKALKSNRESVLDNRIFKSMNLRLLIHIIQDIHQPLHTTSTKFTNPVIEAVKGGDRGGNMFVFKFDPETDGKFKQNNAILNEQPEDKLGYRLHKFLDYIVFEYEDITLPLNRKNYEYLNFAALNLIHRYQSEDIVSDEEIGETYDWLKWVKEGVQLCKEEVYRGIEYGQSEKPSQEYISRMKVILERQIFKAGKRLANVLNDMYSSNVHIVRNPSKNGINKDISLSVENKNILRKENESVSILNLLSILIVSFFVIK